MQNLPRLENYPPTGDRYKAFLDDIIAQGFKGSLGRSYAERLSQATDNSIYQILPEAVIYPQDAEDVALVVSMLSREVYKDLKISPRGGGTGTNGQSLSSGLILDLSKHMNQIIELAPDSSWVKVQAGVVLDQLNRSIKDKGHFFAPDLSPSNRATLGGMINTDACGKGSRIYGKTSQHILELDLVLSDGSRWQSVPIDSEKLRELSAQDNLLGEVCRTCQSIHNHKSKLVQEKFPQLTRFLTGYNLAKIFDKDQHLDLSQVIAGSEGTLAFVVGAKLNLCPIPPFKQLVLVKYRDFQSSLAAAQGLLQAEPAAIETVDDTIISLARQDVIWHQVAKFFSSKEDQDVASVNLVEFIAFDQADIEKQVGEFVKIVEGQIADGGSEAPIGFGIATEAVDINALWSLRKKGVGLLGNRPGNRRPIPFVEDTVVPPEQLAAYIKEFRELLDSYGLEYGMFGHVDVGCLHVRPALNRELEKDEALVREISDRVKNLVLKYHGVIWGEHGKGLRGEYLPDFFGEELYASLRDLKKAFDPFNKMNPGKLVAPTGSRDPVLRLDEVPLRGQYDRKIGEPFQKQFQEAINCNGNGACFNFDTNDVMCPSYKGSRERLHSPKGRAGILREWLRQLSDKGFEAAQDFSKIKTEGREKKTAYDFSHEVYEAMDGCLSCKACSSQCPIKVDIPEMKSKFLAYYHSRYQRPRSDRMIARGESIHAGLLGVPWLYNVAIKLPLASWVLKKVFGLVDSPSLSSPNYKEQARKADFEFLDNLNFAELSEEEQSKIVFLLPDAITCFYEAETFVGVLQAMKRLGYRPVILKFLDNGKGQHVKGFLKEFLQTAEKMTSYLTEVSKLKRPILGIDPAITLTYREEYVHYLGEKMKGIKVWMPQEFLTAELESGRAPWLDVQHPLRLALQEQNHPVYTWLGHCGEKTAIPQSANQWQAVFASLGLQLAAEASGCCGMAGAYGHEARHLEDSKTIFKQSWGPIIDRKGLNHDPVLATGASCRSQSKRFSGKALDHPLALLARI